MNQFDRHLTVALGEGEAPWSLSSRLSLKLGVTHDELAGWIGTTVQKIGAGQPEAIRRLGTANRCDVEELGRHATVRSAASFCHIGGETFQMEQFARLRLRICPPCVSEDIERGTDREDLRPFYRVGWHLSVFRTCGRHGTALVELARLPGLREFRDFGRSIQPFLPKLPALVRDAVPVSTLPLQAYLERRQEQGIDHTWFAGVPAYAVIRMSDLLGFAKLTDRYSGLQKLPDEKRQEVQSVGFEIGAAGPDSIHSLLQELDGRFFDSKVALGPSKLYRRLYDWLEGWGVQDPAYAGLISVVREHVLDSLPMGHGDLLFGKLLEERRVHSIASLARTSGVHCKRVRQLLMDNGLTEADSMDIPDGRVLVPAKEAEVIVDVMQTVMRLPDIAQLLGATPKLVNALVRQNRIPASKGTISRPMRVRSDVEPVLRKLQASVVEGDDGRGLMPLRAAVRSSMITLDLVVELILERKLRRVASTSPNVQFSTLLVDVEELKDACRLDDHGQYGIVDAGEFLGCGRKMINRLVKAGHLTTTQVKNPMTKSPQTVIRTEALVQFKNTYVTLAELAEQHSIRRFHLGVTLHKHEVPMIRVSNTSTVFYDRIAATPIARMIAARRK
jgi:hypothetical protein